MKRSWFRRERPPRTVYVGSHEDKLSRLAALHMDPDDDGRTREDREAEKAEGRPPAASGGAGMI
jgi:protein involved in temperature-dependent protein secretion